MGLTEVWKPIKGYEGQYAISSMGRIKSLSRSTPNHTGIWKRPERILAQTMSDRGYYKACLYRNNKKKHFRVHSLVAEAFLPNPGNLKEVNHIDGNKLNNSISNLEYVTHSQNMKHAVKIGLLIPPQRYKKKVTIDGQACNT
jgi:hypothetical protein